MSYGPDRRRDDPLHPGHREHRPKAKKDTKRWCRGKVGVEHVPVIAAGRWSSGCSTAPSWWSDGPWWCRHERVCEACGKVLDAFLPWRECPDLPEKLKESA